VSGNPDRWPLADGDDLHPSNLFDDTLVELMDFLNGVDMSVDQRMMLMMLTQQLRSAQRMGRQMDWELLHAIDVLHWKTAVSMCAGCGGMWPCKTHIVIHGHDTDPGVMG